MTKVDTSLFNSFIRKWCREQPLGFLFRKYPVVLVGDELGAFYLDRWVTSTEETAQPVTDRKDDPYFLWNRRNQYETNISYMELVYAAHENGVNDIVIDMSANMQPGIDKGLEEYGRNCVQKSNELIYTALLHSAVPTPMDAIVQMAGGLGMKVHALNAGLTGIATFFREARVIEEAKALPTFAERKEAYLRTGLTKDLITLRYLIRRMPTELEAQTMLEQMLLRLSDEWETLSKTVFDETPTAKLIRESIGDKPFLAFFQNARLFGSYDDLDARLRFFYGDKKVCRLSIIPLDNHDFLKHPQYSFKYSISGCTVAMTEEQVRHEQKLPSKP